MDDREKRSWLQVMAENDKYLLAYDKISDTNPNLRCDFSLFTPNSMVVAKVQIHAYNFPKTKTRNASLDYTFHLQNIYLVKSHKKRLLHQKNGNLVLMNSFTPLRGPRS